MQRPILGTVLCLLLSTLAALPARALGDESAPFLTSAERTDVETSSGATREAWVPGDEKVAYVWSDSVFAVHVPFQLETKKWDRSDVIKDVGKAYELTATVSGFTYKEPKTGNDLEPHFIVHNVGGYRFDGAHERHHKGQIIWSISSKPSRSGPEWRYLDFSGEQTPGPVAAWLVLQPSDESVAWLGPDAWAAFGDQAEGTVHVVVRKKEGDDKGIVAQVDVPLRMRQNGWVVRQAKATATGAWGTALGERHGLDWATYDGSTTAQPGRVVTSWRIVGSPLHTGVQPVDSTVNLSVQFTPTILDHGVTDASFTYAQTAGRSGHPENPFFVDRTRLTLFPYPPNEDGTPETDGQWGQSLYAPSASKIPEDSVPGRFSHTTKFQHGDYYADGMQVNLLPVDWCGDVVGDHHIGQLEVRLWGGDVSDDQRPRKLIDLYATRRSEIEDNSIGTVEEVELPKITAWDDGYMTWLPKHGEVVRENQSRINTVRGALKALKIKTGKADKQFRHLLRLTQTSFQWHDPKAGGDFIEEVFASMREPNLRHESLSPEMLKSLKEKREELARVINADRAQQRELIAEAEGCMQTIVASMEAQVRRSEGRRKAVTEDAQHWSDESRTLAADLYHLAGLWEEMEAALSRYDYGTEAVQEIVRLRTAQREEGLAALAERKLWLQNLSEPTATPVDIVSTARQHEINSWKAARDTLEINPHNLDATFMLLERELRFLDHIGRKMARERQLAQEAFETYLRERGYDPDEPSGWWDGIMEVAYAAWATGPVGTASGFLGKPQDQAERAGTIQLQAATAQMSLMFITRLRRTGMPMADIREITPEKLLERMRLRSLGDEVLDDLKVRRIVTDIRETFIDLPELAALAEGDAEKLSKYIARTSYAPEDVGSTWPEYFGDLFSARHLLFLAAPSAVTEIGGQRQVFGVWRTVGSRAASVGGEVKTGHDLLASTLQIERLAKAFSRRKLGGAVAGWIQADMEFLAAVHTVSGSATVATRLAQAGTAVTRLAAAFVIYGGIHHFADEYDVPALKGFVDAVAMLGVGQMAHQALGRAGILPRTALRKIGKFEKVIQGERQVLGRDQQAIAELRDINRKLKTRSKTTSTKTASSKTDTKVLTPGEVDKVNTIAKAARSNAPRPVTGTNANADTAKALETAARALRNGDDDAATKAIHAAEEISKARATGIKKATATASKARRNAEAMLKEPPPKLNRFDQERAPSDVIVPDRFIPRKEVTRGRDRGKLKKIYDELGDIGHDLRLGDQAFRRNDFAQSRKSYRNAKDLSGNNPEHRRMIDRRLNLARNGQGAKKIVDKVRAETKRLRSPDPIDEGELAIVVEQVAAGGLRLDYHKGSANPVFFVRDTSLPADAPAKYVFKINKVKDPKQILGGNPDELVAEELGAVLANALGVAAPGTRRVRLNIPRIKHQADKRFYQGVHEGVLTRFLPGKELHDVGEDLIVALKSDYARIRVLRAWLGDYDGHLKNLMLGTDGELYLLDAGYACWRKSNTPMHIVTQKANLSQKELVSYAVHYPALMSKIKRGTPESMQFGLYHWIDRVDDMVHYDDMRPMVDAIQKLCGNKKELKRLLRKVIGKRNPTTGAWEPDEVQITETMQLYIERSKILDEVLGPKFSSLGLRLLPRSDTPTWARAA